MTRPILTSVADAARDVDGVDPLDEATRMRLRHGRQDNAGVWTDGEAGFAWRHEGALDLVVAPSARGRGVGSRLAEQALAQPGPLTAWSHADHPAAAVLARRHGFERARELWVMRRSAVQELPDLVVPAGVSVRGYRPTDDAEVLRVNAAAFAHHPEQGGMDAANLAERMAEPWFDAAGLLVADTGSGLAGFHWTKRHDAQRGEVYVVAIDPAAQGRGLGRVLTLAGLYHLREVGVAEVLLYVESDNKPAIGLYEGLGFAHAQADTHVQYRRT